jgi:RNA polymerase sigma-70 factor (ECF subfamily)
MPTKNSDAVYDELLVLRWQSGEAEALSELVDRWHARLFRHVRRLTDSADDAAEVVQESWLAMIRSIENLDDSARFPAWAYRIASNKAADYVRKKSRHRTVPLAEPEQLVAKTSASESDDLLALLALLAKLSVEHRAVVSFRYGEEMPLETIADTLNIPLGTVKSRLHYALEFLRTRTK